MSDARGSGAVNPLPYDAAVAEELQRWLEWLGAGKRFSRHTLAAYRIDVLSFLQFLARHRGEEVDLAALDSVTPQDLRAWLAHRATEADFAASSTARATSALRSYYAYLRKQGVSHNQFPSEMRTPKLKNRLPKALSEEQTAHLLETIAAYRGEDWIGLRDRALLMLLYGSGLRIGEALSLTVEDCAPRSGLLRVTGKRSKTREVPLLPLVASALSAYQQACPWLIGKGKQKLFYGKQGKPLQPAIIQKHLRQLRRQLNLPEFTTPHTLRHAYATHLLSAGAGLRDIQELLGHEHLSTTQRYTHVDTTRLLSAYSGAHPKGKA